jgi:hypothetical protein
MCQHYKDAMFISFNENFEVLKKAGEAAMRKSFMITGKRCKILTADEYADLAVKTFEEVKKGRIFPKETI